MPKTPELPPIHTVRRQRVMLDSDLARLYGVTTKVFNQAIKRNGERFPADFAFQLTAREFATMWSQFVTTYAETTGTQPAARKWSQFATTSKPQRRRLSNRPWAFTEHEAVMA